MIAIRRPNECILPYRTGLQADVEVLVGCGMHFWRHKDLSRTCEPEVPSGVLDLLQIQTIKAYHTFE